MSRFRSFCAQDHPANDDDANTIYARSHFAQAELLKLMVSLATGALAVFFLSVTGDRAVPEGMQRIPALVALGSMGVAVFSGIFAWFSESRRQFFWSLAKSTQDEARRKEYLGSRDRAYLRTTVAMLLLVVSFSTGIAASVAYIAMRILQWT
jgi:hypothetical protein